jgi:hypothetical protein
VAWSIGIQRVGTDGYKACDWLSMDRDSTWSNASRVRTSLETELSWLQILGVEQIDAVRPRVKVGDIVCPTKKGWTGLKHVVRKVRKVSTPATPHGYTYIATCSWCGREDMHFVSNYGGGKHLAGGSDPSALLCVVDGKYFKGKEYNHMHLVIVGNTEEGLYEVSDSVDAQSEGWHKNGKHQPITASCSG